MAATSASSWPVASLPGPAEAAASSGLLSSPLELRVGLAPGAAGTQPASTASPAASPPPCMLPGCTLVVPLCGDAAPPLLARSRLSLAAAAAPTAAASGGVEQSRAAGAGSRPRVDWPSAMGWWGSCRGWQAGWGEGARQWARGELTARGANRDPRPLRGAAALTTVT